MLENLKQIKQYYNENIKIEISEFSEIGFYKINLTINDFNTYFLYKWDYSKEETVNIMIVLKNIDNCILNLYRR